MSTTDKINERDVVRYFKKRIKEAGGELRRVQWIGRRGAPDNRAMLNGYCTWVEFKAPGLELAPHQAREIDRMCRQGEVVWVLDSYAEVDAWFLVAERYRLGIVLRA